MGFIKKTIKTKTDFNVDDLDIRKEARESYVKALFIHGKNDKMIKFEHS